MFLEKGVLKICSRFTGERPCRRLISIKLLCSFTEITLQHGCFPVNLPHIFRTPFTSEDITVMVGISVITQLFWMTNSLVKMFSLVLQILIISSFQNYVTLKKPQNSFQQEIQSNDLMILDNT